MGTSWISRKGGILEKGGMASLTNHAVSSYHVTYAFQSESTLYSCLNVKELLAWNRSKIWSLNDCNWTQTHNHLVRNKLKSKFQNNIYKHLHYNQQNPNETKSNLKTFFYMTPFWKSVKEVNTNLLLRVGCIHIA